MSIIKQQINSLTIAFALLTGFALTSNAQTTSQKIGENPTIKNAGAILELESTNKGLLLPRISLNNTTSWGLAGTQVKGMAVFNINTSITGSTTYPVAGGDRTGIYFWDGTGWLATASAAGNDPTKDAWVDDPTNTRVQLGTLSDGSTARPLGTEVVVKDDGKVGIGTLNPVWSLDVQGTSAIGHFKRFTGSSIFNVAPSLLFTRSRGTATAESDVSPGDFLGKVQFRGRTAGVDEDYGVMAYIANSTTPGDGRFGFFNLHGDVNSIEVISVNTKTGNLGVGSTSPTSRLYLSGYARLGSTDATADGLTTPANRAGMIRYNSTLKAFQYHDNTQWVTPDPTTDSWVDDPTNTRVQLGTLSDGSTARPAGTEVVIKDDGKLGVGTTTPQNRLHVNGSTQLTGELSVGGNATTTGNPGTAGQVLTSNGAGAAPSWAAAPGAATTNAQTVTVASGATSASFFVWTNSWPTAIRIKVFSKSNCGPTFYNEFIATGSNTTSNWVLNYVGGMSRKGAPSSSASSTNTEVTMTNPTEGCQGEGMNAFGYTLKIGANTGSLTIINNGTGTVARDYRVIIERIIDNY